VRPKIELFAVKFRRISEVSAFYVYRDISGQIFTIYVSKNEAACDEVQNHFATFPLANLIKKLWAHFHDFCVAQKNILDFKTLQKCFGHVL